MILLTGATGFLGRAIAASIPSGSLRTLGRSADSDLVFDFTKIIPLLPSTTTVIHAAGKAHVIPRTLAEEQEFYTVNVQGTLNILKGLEQAPSLPNAFVFISSVAVYGRETGQMIDEESPLNATDAYGKTKIQAEQLVQHWCGKNAVKCTILRLPLIAGPNPPGNLKTMIQALNRGYYFNIGGGIARKSIVLATDVATIIPLAAEVGGTYNLTDGRHPTFSEIASYLATKLGKRQPVNMPLWMAMVLAKTGDAMGGKFPLNSDKLSKITSDLTFDDSRARNALGWNPHEVLKAFEIR